MADIKSFIAKSSSFPNTVDLSWELTDNLGATEQVQIRRQITIYPGSDEGDLIYTSSDSTITNFRDDGQNTKLTDNTYFYYTIFIFNTATSEFTESRPFTRDFAISYKNWGEGDRLFSTTPEGLKANDLVFGGNYEKVVDTIGNMADYYRSIVCAAGFFRRPDKIAENLLDFYSEMFGFLPERGFDLRVLRNIPLGLIQIYKKKGTCDGLVDFTKLFTGWDSICNESVDLTFKIWDGTSQRNLSYYTSIAASKVTDANANFTNNIWTNGKFVDSEDDPFYKVLSNDSKTITFNNRTPPFVRLDGTSGVGIDAVTFQDVTQSWTVDEWKGYRLFIPSFSTDYYFVVFGNDSDTLFLNPLFGNFGSPETYQQIGIDIVANMPVSYSLEPEYYVQNGQHSLLFDNTVPSSFRGLTKDPAHFLLGGTRSLLSLGQFSENSLILVIKGVADFVGRSTDLTATVLTDDNPEIDFGAADSLVGKRLNPNILQENDFEIVSNTSNTITVIGDLLSIAAIGNNYAVLSELDSIKSKRLREVIPEFLPFYAQPFIFFEPK